MDKIRVDEEKLTTHHSPLTTHRCYHLLILGILQQHLLLSVEQVEGRHGLEVVERAGFDGFAVGGVQPGGGNVGLFAFPGFGVGFGVDGQHSQLALLQGLKQADVRGHLAQGLLAAFAFGVVEHQQQAVAFDGGVAQGVAAAVGQVVGEVGGRGAGAVQADELQAIGQTALADIVEGGALHHATQVDGIERFAVEGRVGVEQVVVHELHEDGACMCFTFHAAAQMVYAGFGKGCRCGGVGQQGQLVDKGLFGDVTVVYQHGVGKVELVPVVAQQEVLACFGFRQGDGYVGVGELGGAGRLCSAFAGFVGAAVLCLSGAGGQAEQGGGGQCDDSYSVHGS